MSSHIFKTSELEADREILVTFVNIWCFYRFGRVCKCGFVLQEFDWGRLVCREEGHEFIRTQIHLFSRI